MADIIVDGKVKVQWVPTVANIAAPTVAEIGAGISLELTLTQDGLVGFGPETADVDNTSLGSTFSTKLAGRAEFSGTLLRFKKQDGTDTIYNTLAPLTNGYVVIRRAQGLPRTTAFAAAQQVEVHPVQVGYQRTLDPEPNSVARVEFPVKVSSEPNLRAVVA